MGQSNTNGFGCTYCQEQLKSNEYFQSCLFSSQIVESVDIYYRVTGEKHGVHESSIQILLIRYFIFPSSV